MGMSLADSHAYLVHVTVKALRAILAFQLNGRVGNLVLALQKKVNILDNVAGIAHLGGMAAGWAYLWGSGRFVGFWQHKIQKHQIRFFIPINPGHCKNLLQCNERVEIFTL